MSAFERTLKYLIASEVTTLWRYTNRLIIIIIIIVSYRIVSCCDRRRQRVTGISGAPCAISSTLTMSCSAQHPCFIIIPHSSHSHSFASPNLSPCVLTMHPPKWSSFTFCRIPNSSHFFLLHHYPPFFTSTFICISNLSPSLLHLRPPSYRRPRFIASPVHRISILLPSPSVVSCLRS